MMVSVFWVVQKTLVEVITSYHVKFRGEEGEIFGGQLPV